jgi:hypothetical protein
VPVAETISARNRNGVQSESARAHHSNRVHYRGEVNAIGQARMFFSQSVFKKPPAFGHAWPQAPGSGDPIHQFRRCDVQRSNRLLFAEVCLAREMPVGIYILLDDPTFLANSDDFDLRFAEFLRPK